MTREFIQLMTKTFRAYHAMRDAYATMDQHDRASCNAAHAARQRFDIVMRDLEKEWKKP